MIIFKYSNDLQQHLQKINLKMPAIGFVPTMGALHAGHISLIDQSKKQTDITVCSIYVNPVQFNNSEDFERYPITVEADILLLEKSGCDILFLPGEKEIYPDEPSKNKHFEIGYLESILEGQFRPGHFQGVCMVVEKLLNIINPTHLFLGQKDYQQSLVIKKLIGLMNKNIIIKICPTLRETNGLAISSRNLRLSDDEKNIAAELHRSLLNINDEVNNGNLSSVKNKEKNRLEQRGFKVDYIELAKAKSLEIVDSYNGRDELVLLLAAYLNNVRLIDNIPVTA